MKRKNFEKGFTLIELLLVVVIIGLMLSVIVPRAWRANIDAKYGLVRQNCAELASFGQEWAENQLLAQNESTSTATVDSYLATLANENPWGIAGYLWVPSFDWVANQSTSNWNLTGTPIAITGRNMGADEDVPPETSVEGIIPPEKVIRNPFNEVNVFQISNHPTSNVVTGAIACGTIAEGSGVDIWHYYGFLFQGTDSTTIINADTSFFAGQAVTLAGLRNGIFFARLRP